MKKHPSLIFLTGFSGSGKSTIGPLLANSLGYEFLDLDHLIETLAGKPITRIFAEDGESSFRELESNTLKELACRDELVVSLGGGVLENDSSFAVIRENGTLVYLHSSSGILAKRLCNKTDRPLLKGDNGKKLDREELEEKIETILSRRAPRYESADITVQTDSKRIGSTVEELTRKIERYLRKTVGGGDQK
ncbi:MAG: shikimate kinase [Chlorobiaceae bacterium]|nr:shikimate kinase [Chlorobiaceae bacterium]NTW11072.1 shikimate kinase [Chlorobiaceae bacterium]